MTEIEKLDPNAAATLEDKVLDVIKTVYDPEIPVNIYELGLIYEIKALPLGKVHILMTLTSPNCPAAQSMPAEIETKVGSLEEVDEVEIEITFDPPWDQEMMSEEAKLELGFM